jgi:hypothetical protein
MRHVITVLEAAARRQQAAIHAQMLIDQCLEERAQLTRFGQFVRTDIVRQEDG